MISVYFRYFFIVKVCSFVIVRYVFWFSKMFIVCRFAIKFFTEIGPNLKTNSIIFVQSVSIFNQKIHPFIIIQVINKALLIFSTRRNLYRWQCIISAYIEKNKNFVAATFLILNFNIIKLYSFCIPFYML